MGRLRQTILICTALFALCSCTRRLPQTPFIHLYSDDFARPDQDLSSSARWNVETPSASVFDIVDEMAWPGRGSGAIPTALFYNPVGLPNSKVVVDIYVLGGTLANPNMKILARYDADHFSTSTNGYECGMDGNPYITLIRNGVTVATGETVFNFLPNEVYTLSFAQIGNGIFCEIEQEDGEYEVIGFNDTNRWERGHYFGLGGGESGGNYGYFDDFHVYGK